MSERRTGKWTLLEVLDWTKGHFEAKGLPSARLDAEVLLSHVLGLKRVMLYARFDQPMHAEELTTMRGLVARRARGEPIAHLVGKREFWSLELTVTADTLVPRPDSETLIEVALDEKRDAKRVLDVGTGSGALALALASELPEAAVVATDVSPAALEVATGNAKTLGLEDRVTFLQGDLLAALPAGTAPFDLVVANLPYIPSPDMATLMPDVRDYEPHLALDGGPDGLVLIARLLAELGPILAPGAAVLLEAGPDQVPGLPARFETAGFERAATRADGAGHPRVAWAHWPSP